MSETLTTADGGLNQEPSGVQVLSEEAKANIERSKADDAAGAELPTDPLDNPALNKAAYDFGKLSPIVATHARAMLAKRGKGLYRVFRAIMEYPFANDYTKFKSQEEQQLFMLCLHMLSVKGIMSKALEGQVKDIETMAVDGLVKEIVDEKTKEASNG